MGTLSFLWKTAKRKESQSPAAFRREEKSHLAVLGCGRTLLGPQKKSRRFCHLHQKNAIAIAEKSRHLVHSALELTLLLPHGLVLNKDKEVTAPLFQIRSLVLRALETPWLLGHNNSLIALSSTSLNQEVVTSLPSVPLGLHNSFPKNCLV